MATAIKISSAVVTILAVVACWMFLTCFAANVPQTHAGRICHYVEAQSSHIFSIQPSLARRMRLTVSFRAWFRYMSSTGSSFVLNVGEAPASPYELLRVLASKTGAELSMCRGLASTEKGESYPVLLLRNASIEVASMSYIFFSHVKAIDSDQLTITYHCGQSPERQCIKVDISSAFQHSSDNQLRHTRNKRTITLSSQYKSSLSYSAYSVPAMILFIVTGLLALMAVIAICAKGTEPREHTGESSLKSSIQQNENQDAATANDRPVSATEEVKLVMESPVVANNLENSGQAGGLADSGNHSETDQLSSRKSMEPLPLPPEAEEPQANRPTPPPPSPPEDDDENEEEEDNPYDYARVPGRESDVEISDNDSGNEAQQDEDGAARGPPGRYAKVTRHSGNKETDYEPMPDLPGPPLPSMRERRDRSVTEPIDPMHLGEKKARSMTVVAESASGMPLPAVPPVKFAEEAEEPEDDMYDCIKDDLKAAIRQSAENQSPQKVYDSVDGENDMYESVTEEMKESVQHQLTPALPLSPVPKSQQKANSNSPSPTKRHSGSGFLDSPKTRKAKEAAKRMNSKDASKEGKKKKLDPAPQEGEGRSRHFSFIFNRKKTPSVSGKPQSSDTKQDTPTEQLPSPGHRPFSSVPLPSIPPSLGPRPAVPIPRPVSYAGHDDNVDEDEGGMYDSVTQPLSRSVPDSEDILSKLVPATRGGGGANPHFNEPLPDVPEDSGSGSAGGGASVVKHPRVVEMSDPSYDTVVGSQRQEELPCDPNYDTVQLPQFARKPQQQPVSSASASTPPYRPSPERDESVSHDEQGYAVVDPNVILRKRVSSLSKSAMKEANDEPGYEKVKKDDDQSEEPGYESVTKQQEEAEYDSLDQIGGTEPVQPVEPGYASVTRLPDGTPILEQDESTKEPGYEKVRTDSSPNDDQADKQKEPDYDKVTEEKEPEYDSLDQIENAVQQPVEPGYATVTGHAAAGISKPSTTVDKDDEMYSHVDLAKKHKNKETDQEMLSSTVEEDRVTSPAPPIPAQGDLGDISEFEPPPIPEPQFDLLENDDVIEPPYATVTKSGSDETSKTSEDIPVVVEWSEMDAVNATCSTQADSTVSEPTNNDRLPEPIAEETVSESTPAMTEPTAEEREEEEEMVINASSVECEEVSSTPADEEHTESTPSSAEEETPANATREKQTEGTSTTTDTPSDKPDSVSTNRLLSASLEESQPMYDSLESTVTSSTQSNHTNSEAAKLPVENVYDSLQAVEGTESS